MLKLSLLLSSEKSVYFGFRFLIILLTKFCNCFFLSFYIINNINIVKFYKTKRLFQTSFLTQSFPFILGIKKLVMGEFLPFFGMNIGFLSMFLSTFIFHISCAKKIRYRYNWRIEVSFKRFFKTFNNSLSIF